MDEGLGFAVREGGRTVARRHRHPARRLTNGRFATRAAAASFVCAPGLGAGHPGRLNGSLEAPPRRRAGDNLVIQVTVGDGGRS